MKRTRKKSKKPSIHSHILLHLTLFALIVIGIAALAPGKLAATKVAAPFSASIPEVAGRQVNPEAATYLAERIRKLPGGKLAATKVAATLDSPAAATYLPDEIRKLPGGNFLSEQPDTNTLKQVLATGLVERILRHNSSTRQDNGGVPIEVEVDIALRYDVTLHFVNMHENGAYTTSANLYAQGGTWGHCQHGKHRAPSAAAYWLQLIGWNKASILKAVGWENFLERQKTRYHRYYYNVFPNN